MVKLLDKELNDDFTNLHDLIGESEAIVIVDDSPEIVLLLSSYLKRQHLPHKIATCAKEFYPLLEHEQVALVLLDIGLPDQDGTDILKTIAPIYPDLGIVMVTGTTDLQIALQCLREGADDYLPKPVNIQQFNHTIHQTLKKRRLAIDNRLFQQELEATNFRTQFLHHLNHKMNTAYLNTVELNGVLQAILVGITSKEGLQFNRAFLALFDEDRQVLQGRLAIGPSRKEDANRVWNDIRDKNLQLQDMIDDIINGNLIQDVEINRIAKDIEISIANEEHILIEACTSRQSVLVQEGFANGHPVDNELLSLLDESNFIITPLYSPSTSLGVIIADNYITNKQLTEDDINSLEIFASQASLAIEHSQLYRDMSIKIDELEQATSEIEKSRELLIEAEKLSTIGHMSAQIVHAIRNPITALGGTARLLARKSKDSATTQFTDIIIKETGKIETTLDDLFNYVTEEPLHRENCSINDLLQQCVIVFYPTMQEKNIETELLLDDYIPVLRVDRNRMKQVFHHLIKNSIEAMEQGGIVTILTAANEQRVTITVNDTGSGLDDQSLTKATDAFYTTKTYGTGMGLTVVEQIISRHEGKLSLQRNTAGGTEAVITLPFSLTNNARPT